MAEKEFKVNDYITFKLENDKSFIYIMGKKFLQCIKLLLNIPKGNIKHFKFIDSIDEAAEKTTHLYQNKIIGEPTQTHSISPEQEFWGHCSNIQAWVENNYDTRLLHSNLAFPLLKKLTEVGVTTAKKVFKEEVATRFLSGYAPVRQYLIENGYLDSFDINELLAIGVENIKDLKNVERLIQVSYKLLKKNRLDEVIATYNKVLEIEKQNVGALHILGRALKRKGELEKALELYRECHLKEPLNHHVMSNISEVYSLRKEYDLSIEWANRAIKINPDTYEAYYYLGNALISKRKYNEAIEAYNQALRSNIKDHFTLSDDQILAKLCDLYITLGNPIEALIIILNKFQEFIKNTNTITTWHLHDSKKDLIKDIKDHCLRLESHDFSRIDELMFVFYPMSKLQRVLITSGWGFNFLITAQTFDKVFNVIIEKFELDLLLSKVKGKNLLNKQKLETILSDHRIEIESIFTRYLDKSGTNYIVPNIPLTLYQVKLYKKLNKIFNAIFKNKELLPEFEIIALERKMEKIATEFIVNLKNSLKV